MVRKKSEEGLTVKKSEDFSEWFSQVISKAEIVDMRLDVKGFMVIRPWGARIMERMFKMYEEELQKNGHLPTFMPSLIPEKNLKKESSHIEGFIPEVFWLEKQRGEERLALRPTSETLYTPMFKLWIRSHNELPMKLYQRGSVFRLDTKSTRPLIRTREILWIEAHDAFASKEEAEDQVKQDIEITERVMHQKFGVPFLPMKRPSWDRFAGAEYTVASDVIMPDGKLIQQPSTHLMGQKFSKAFDATFTDEDGKEKYLWTTAYGPAISRILVSIISLHGDDKGLVLPFEISPIQVEIVPIYNKDNKKEILRFSEQIKNKLEKINLEVEIDKRENYSPGWKFNECELRGIPFRIDIGKNELKEKSLTLFIRDQLQKKKISLKNLSSIKKEALNYDKRLLKKADDLYDKSIVNCSTKKSLAESIRKGKIARVNWCSVEKEGIPCAEHVEKELHAEVRGSLGNKKELPKGKCIICGKPAKQVVYIGRSY